MHSEFHVNLLTFNLVIAGDREVIIWIYSSDVDAFTSSSTRSRIGIDVLYQGRSADAPVTHMTIAITARTSISPGYLSEGEGLQL